jgi:hypothetical protein
VTSNRSPPKDAHVPRHSTLHRCRACMLCDGWICTGCFTPPPYVSVNAVSGGFRGLYMGIYRCSTARTTAYYCITEASMQPGHSCLPPALLGTPSVSGLSACCACACSRRQTASDCFIVYRLCTAARLMMYNSWARCGPMASSRYLEALASRLPQHASLLPPSSELDSGSCEPHLAAPALRWTPSQLDHQLSSARC